MSPGDDARCDAPAEHLAAEVLDQIAESLAVFDEHGRVVHANAAARALNGRVRAVTRDRLSVSHFCRPDGTDLPLASFPVERTRLTGIEIADETVGIAAANGETCWLRVSTRPLAAAEPPVATIMTARDITAEVAARHAERRADERFAAAFESATVGMVIAELDGAWIEINDALCDMLGYTKAALLEQTLLDVTFSDDADVHERFVGACLSGEQDDFEMTKRYVRADGRVIWGACLHIPGPRSGWLTGVLCLPHPGRHRTARAGGPTEASGGP